MCRAGGATCALPLAIALRAPGLRPINHHHVNGYIAVLAETSSTGDHALRESRPDGAGQRSQKLGGRLSAMKGVFEGSSLKDGQPEATAHVKCVGPR